MKVRNLIGAIIAAGLAASAANAQNLDNYEQRQSDLTSLSSVFGSLHYIRRICEPRIEANIWRERMKEIIKLEDPAPKQRDDMVAAFNAAYNEAQRRYPRCSRRAEDFAAMRAAMGNDYVARLAGPLYETLRNQDNANLSTEGPPAR